MLIDELDTLLNVLNQQMDEFNHQADNENDFGIERYDRGVAHGLSIAIYTLDYLVDSWKEKTPEDWRDNMKLAIHKKILIDAINDLHATKETMKVGESGRTYKQLSDYAMGVEIDGLNDIANRLKGL
jgi:hypothetical protein